MPSKTDVNIVVGPKGSADPPRSSENSVAPVRGRETLAIWEIRGVFYLIADGGLQGGLSMKHMRGLFVVPKRASSVRQQHDEAWLPAGKNRPCDPLCPVNANPPIEAGIPTRDKDYASATRCFCPEPFSCDSGRI